MEKHYAVQALNTQALRGWQAAGLGRCGARHEIATAAGRAFCTFVGGTGS